MECKKCADKDKLIERLRDYEQFQSQLKGQVFKENERLRRLLKNIIKVINEG
jgi:hypothetical protein